MSFRRNEISFMAVRWIYRISINGKIRTLFDFVLFAINVVSLDMMGSEIEWFRGIYFRSFVTDGFREMFLRRRFEFRKYSTWEMYSQIFCFFFNRRIIIEWMQNLRKKIIEHKWRKQWNNCIDFRLFMISKWSRREIKL